MSGRDDKARRKELLKALRDQQRQKIRAGLPASMAELKGLFDFLDSQLSTSSCDHSLRFTTDYLCRHALDVALITGWLKEQGGYCDCEVLSNVEETVNDAVPEGSDAAP